MKAKEMEASARANANVSDEVLIALRRLIRAIDLHSRYLSKHFGLTGPQLIILRELAREGEMSSGEIAASVSLSQATVTGITDRLEKRGLVTKTKSDIDRRRVVIQPTTACQALLDQAPPPIQESFLNQFDKLRDWEQSMILSSLQRLVQMIDARDIKAEPVLTAGPIGNISESGE
ncbi:MarR family winged helix-turn-helix transcriptional regulator [Desulfosarcina ovata]|uniref:MarR family transcriptional regulator n=2 Tax=Desulfosarcina ovata TaxID=83564 RepID=A0A5K8A819_9BACT|nr:MarR family transcriptional regulator [Desulfosarcina ovata]BBO81411.1 MarR family transcriptional regulator [Desulfosarcina ovata subsp. sediminis]BBO88667.1 MarR family transcriptional regulator [Desulfosarcina ovata subsp. ovata]